MEREATGIKQIKQENIRDNFMTINLKTDDTGDLPVKNTNYEI